MVTRKNGFILDRRQVLAGLGGIGAAGVLGLGDRQANAQASEIVLANYGGDDVKTMKEAFTDSFTKDTGIPVAYDTSGPNTGKIRAMMDGGKPIWDVCDSGPAVGIGLGRVGMLEEIDYSIVDKSKVLPGYAMKYNVGSYLFSSLIVYNKAAVKDHVPQNWADFYNFKEFPGKRALSRISQGMLEGALIADGVPMDKLYPLDVERALEKIKSVKSEILFWRTAAEGNEFLRSGEVSMAVLWSPFASSLKRQTNGAVDFHFNQAILQCASWVVPKGNPAGKSAMKLIAHMQDPQRQANYLRINGGGPVNPATNALLTPEEATMSPGSPANVAMQVQLDYAWLADNYSTVEPKYIAAIS